VSPWPKAWRTPPPRAVIFEIPKSRIFTIASPLGSLVRKMFDGFKSRWTTPIACAATATRPAVATTPAVASTADGKSTERAAVIDVFNPPSNRMSTSAVVPSRKVKA